MHSGVVQILCPLREWNLEIAAAAERVSTVEKAMQIIDGIYQ
jgi:hypothetical protein